MNLRSVDLNLLVVLDALLDEVHVSRAATRLNLSQPATSASLGRLRQLFGDALLERADGAMRLTPTGEALRSRVKSLLDDAQALLALQPEPLNEIEKVIRIVTADHLVARLADRLHAHLRDTAPGLILVFDPYLGPAGTLDALSKGSVDLAVSVLPNVAPPIRREVLLRERWLVLLRKDHPAAADLSLERWLAFPHIAVSGRGVVRTPVDDRVEALGRSRRIAVTVPSFLIVPPLVARSDLLGLVPALSVTGTAVPDVVIREPPIPCDSFPIHLAWHVRHDKDMAIQHVKASIRAVLA